MATQDKIIERIERIEKELGIEQPKSREMQKIEELEHKIDKVLQTEKTDSTKETDQEKEETQTESEGKELVECGSCGRKFSPKGLGPHRQYCDGEKAETEEEEYDSLEEYAESLEVQEIDTAKMIKKSLTEKYRKILELIPETNYHASSRIAAKLEDISRSQVLNVVTFMGEKGLVESKKSVGTKLTRLGQRVKEAEVSQPDYSEEETIEWKDLDDSELRKTLLEEIAESEIPPMRKELASKTFKLPESEVTRAIEQKISRELQDLEELDLVEEEPRRFTSKRGSSKAYRIKREKDESDFSQEEEEDSGEDEEKLEEIDDEKVKQNAGVADKDFDVVKLTFDKLVNRNNNQEINYHNFEQLYTGNERPLRMFQKLFQNPELLKLVNRKVCPEKELSWEKKGNYKTGTGAKSWQIVVQ